MTQQSIAQDKIRNGYVNPFLLGAEGLHNPCLCRASQHGAKIGELGGDRRVNRGGTLLTALSALTFPQGL